MSAPDYNDPESKLQLRPFSARPSRFMRAYMLGFVHLWRTGVVFMALMIVPIGYFDLKDHGFRWGTIGLLGAMIALLGVFFLIGTLALRFIRALPTKQP